MAATRRMTRAVEGNPAAGGRDWIVGDVHGCFQTLRQALAAIDFEPGRDRLFSVGDLIDRGPHSNEALSCQGRRETRPKGGAKHCHRGRRGEMVRGGRDEAGGGVSRKRREGVARAQFPAGGDA